METVFETITRLIKEKKDNHVAPVSLTFNEIRKARDKLLREELNNLYKIHSQLTKSIIMEELNEWSEWANKRQQKVFERSEVDTMFLKLADRQQYRDTSAGHCRIGKW